jgi:hypothetical protein
LPSAAETCRRTNKKEKLKVALKTVYFSVYEINIILVPFPTAEELWMFQEHTGEEEF